MSDLRKAYRAAQHDRKVAHKAADKTIRDSEGTNKEHRLAMREERHENKEASGVLRKKFKADRKEARAEKHEAGREFRADRHADNMEAQAAKARAKVTKEV